MKVKGLARVQLTIETVVGNWGTDCQLGQVYLQAQKEAIAAVERALPREWTLVGKPKVTAILTDEGKDE